MLTICGEGVVDLVDAGDGTFRAHPGGSPLSVAVGVARLGAPVSLLARLGGDRFGRLLREHLRAAGVSERDLVAATQPTTLAVVSLDATGRASYDFYVEGTADWQWGPEDLPDPLPPDVTILHTGSLACAVEPAASAIEAMLRREHRRAAVTLTYDPNVRPSLAGERDRAAARVERIVPLVDVVRASDEDVTWLYPGRDVEAVARGWAAAGPALVVLTRGAHGASAWTSTGVRVDRPARPVRVVDTVGAGDAFMAGLLTALPGAGSGRGIRAALRTADRAAVTTWLDRATLVAALTCTRAGAAPPTGEQLDAARTAG